ncbi:MAG: ComF family protein [Candidatus Hydrogenedentes bacterium]|nr:ComF family protein [Candidatus Hydrogenedentota bacterium]
MLKINPIRLVGGWEAGYALDYHTLSSEYLGEDEYGHPQFETARSEVGELLYRLKYRSEKALVKVLSLTASEFVKSRKWPVEIVLPVPPSRSGRGFQPVPLLAKAIAQNLGIPVSLDAVVKVKDTPELKSVYKLEERTCLLQDAYVVVVPEVSEKRVLLVDDLYRSGATLNAVAACLKAIGGVRCVYAVTCTKTRSKR